MNRYKLKCGGKRPQAFFGAEAAAILAAAGINVAGTLASAGISASATTAAAKQQATATMNAATKQAQSIKDQAQNAKELQQESQEFTKEQNAENRELQKDIQMNLQMLTGQQNVNDRLEAAKIQVRNGGSMRRKLCANGSANPLLRGSSNGNIPFIVTDGGGVTPVGITPEGYAMYEIKGNDHDHYHKTSSGKSKTGVGIKFADGKVIEGEGNQNSNQGEYMLTMPNDAVFISKHNIKGFNPAKAINLGMHPLQAFAIQENIKDAYNIPDDGKAKYGDMLHAREQRLFNTWWNKVTNGSGAEYNPDDYATDYRLYFREDNTSMPKSSRSLRSKRLIGGGTSNSSNTLYQPSQTPDLSKDGMAPIATGVAWGYLNGMYGDNSNKNNQAGTNGTKIPSDSESDVQAKLGKHLRRSCACGGRHKALSGSWANVIGAGATTLGNLGGAWITQGANNAASGILSSANTQAANIISDAYRQMTGIDLNSIRKEDYATAHAMAAIQAPIVNTSTQRAEAERSLQRKLTNAQRYSASGAASQDKMSLAETEYNDTINKIENAADQQKQAIIQENMKRITNVANENADRDIQANKEWASAYLSALQYNNNIENEKIAGVANAQANAITGNAAASAQAQQANAAGWASAISNSGQAIGNTISSIYKTQADKQNALLGANSESQVNYAITTGDKAYAKELYNSYKNSTNETQKNYAKRLNDKYNFETTETKAPKQIKVEVKSNPITTNTLSLKGNVGPLRDLTTTVGQNNIIYKPDGTIDWEANATPDFITWRKLNGYPSFGF